MSDKGYSRSDLLDEVEQGGEEFIKSVKVLVDEGVYGEEDLVELLEEEYRKKNALGEMAFYDDLTSVKNRAGFNVLHEREIEEADEESPFTLLFLDMDNFKQINDLYDHITGDNVLKNFAQTINKYVRDYDSVCRLGGDEFAVLLKDVGGEDALKAVENLYNNLMESDFWGKVKYEDKVDHGISIGMVSYYGEVLESQKYEVVTEGENGLENKCKTVSDVLVKMADDAMYLAKNSGRKGGIARSKYIPEVIEDDLPDYLFSQSSY